ncbi:hypothetical protein FOZ60_001583 [Perkinsus olseni]|uniref:Sorl1p n=1 Tax=Perkinsus olseni TaxID=32597 RepID=A0A7J6P169_PEROL|nr:hypothetical protein FOZ60_001583 [Perkinsus olseni]
MYFNSVLLAVLLGTVAGQGTVIRIHQQRLPFSNRSPDDDIHSRLGTFRHIQTLELDDADNGDDFLWLTSIIAKEDGTGLLAVSDDGSFAVMDLSPSANEGISRGWFDRQWSLSRRGRGDLIVSGTDDRGVLRFPDGIQSQQSADLNFGVIFPECSGAVEAILSIQPQPANHVEAFFRIFSGSQRDPVEYLLMFCNEPTDSAPTSGSGNTVYAGSAYDGFVARPFFLE